MPEVFIETNAAQVATILFEADANLRAELQKAGHEIAKGIYQDFYATVRAWSERPSFQSDVDVDVAGGVSVLVGTDSDVYRYVDEGTSPHYIVARNGPVLAFQWAGPGGYRAKTSPGRLSSVEGGPSGPFVFRRWVLHPGFVGRGFTRRITIKWQERAPNVVHTHIESWSRGL